MTDIIPETIDIGRIMEMLPHRYPFQLVDRVLSYELEPERKLTAIKNVTINEPFFPGHFPDNPIMPGVLIIEAMAQACGVLAFVSRAAENKQGGLYYLVKIDKARFNRTVVPGDQLLMEVRQQRMMRNMGLYQCEARVDGERVATAEILCAGRSDS
ncbi:MAG: 3-hydroxyacyl-ACP dehydratase FabZ [Xanthomonadales bacterium]|nr:3-hydroxyacyl-ACP dehydratase FabZ [Xanthomonadales bacterium]NIN59294.1 3-hydroxyacyl-ACP dehydratase FabZ [Xanthomonadales bacterium]NIN74656.1 3-hydroxyacyl-ACP dehydratase FabZ [Xanthomonadales bacterium]NIO13322.1 3-hydroxyacyl-ACP dehydratase FabZ [Xanthomonadales bacterium]NIP11687.1 3-hydroxyacyl-ACP dehydratase FabZ [Xanthomonadales bacterium]